MDLILNEKAKKLEEIYRRNMAQILELSQKQNQLISAFYKKLEEHKIAKIRNKLGLE